MDPKCQPQPPSSEKGQMRPLQGTETILVVDDELAVLSLTSTMLTRHGYVVFTAKSSQEALHLFEVWPDLEVDLLLVDVIMPDMNGIELTACLWDIRPNLEVLYFSAFSGEALLRPLFLRKLPYIAKPFTSLQLTKKIREVLDRSKAEGMAAE
jgi:two-component system cell cycle sensor histidine kinase/response regulator CckA